MLQKLAILISNSFNNLAIKLLSYGLNSLGKSSLLTMLPRGLTARACRTKYRSPQRIVELKKEVCQLRLKKQHLNRVVAIGCGGNKRHASCCACDNFFVILFANSG